MVQQEFYIREQSEDAARGPFTLDQVLAFVEAGTVTPETLFYDSAAEAWTAFWAHPEASAAVFPATKKLSLKAKEISTLNKPDSTGSEISVDDMLAAAEGRTAETATSSTRRSPRAGPPGSACAPPSWPSSWAPPAS